MTRCQRNQVSEKINLNYAALGNNMLTKHSLGQKIYKIQKSSSKKWNLNLTVKVNDDAKLGWEVQVGSDGQVEEVWGDVSSLRATNGTHQVVFGQTS